MRHAVWLSLLLVSNAGLFAATVPFVGCASDGQAGPVPPPPPRVVQLQIRETLEKELAWYQSARFGTLGPRGWHCFEVYGSDGASLWVAPQALGGRQFFGARTTFDGPLIELAEYNGGTSGRDAVAEVIAQVFPAHRQFVRDVVAMFDYPRPRLRYGPWPMDLLSYRGPEFVEYTTPANAEGLGTSRRVVKSRNPIRGFAQVLLPDYDVLQVRVRLPVSMEHLAPAILQQGVNAAYARKQAASPSSRQPVH